MNDQGRIPRRASGTLAAALLLACAAAAALLLVGAAGAAPSPQDRERQVNTFTAGAQSFAPRGAPVQPRHVGGGPRLVDEHQPFGIEIGLTVEPGLAPLYDVRTIPLRGVGGLFLYVRPQRSRNVHRVARAARTPRSARSRASSSLIVRSGVAVIKPRM